MYFLKSAHLHRIAVMSIQLRNADFAFSVGSSMRNCITPEFVYEILKLLQATLYIICAVLIICVFCADFYLLRIARQFQRRTNSLNEANHHLQGKLRREHNNLRRYDSERFNARSSSTGFICASWSRYFIGGQVRLQVYPIYEVLPAIHTGVSEIRITIHQYIPTSASPPRKLVEMPLSVFLAFCSSRSFPH